MRQRRALREAGGAARVWQEGTGSQLDEVRRKLAVEFLQNTSLSVEEIAVRVGLSLKFPSSIV